jgi:hypothetical protein
MQLMPIMDDVTSEHLIVLSEIKRCSQLWTKYLS